MRCMSSVGFECRKIVLVLKLLYQVTADLVAELPAAIYSIFHCLKLFFVVRGPYEV